MGATSTTATREWQAAVSTGLFRVAAGAALLRWRDRAIRLCGGAPTDPVVRGVFTYFGVRDLVLGISTLLATRPGADVSKQIAVQGVADAGDTALVVGLLRTGKLPVAQGSGVAVLAAGTSASNFVTSAKLRRRY